MKLVNETCYDSDDILMLWTLCEEAAQADVDDPDHHTSYLRSAPDTLQIGYYTPKDLSDTDSHVRFSRWRRNGRPPRLAIVRPKHLPLHPLQQLAQAAEEHPAIPQTMVEQIVYHIRSAIGLYGNIPPKEGWRAALAHKIRYAPRARRGSLTDAKKAAKRIQYNALRAQYNAAQRETLRAQRNLRACQGQEDELERKLIAFRHKHKLD